LVDGVQVPVVYLLGLIYLVKDMLRLVKGNVLGFAKVDHVVHFESFLSHIVRNKGRILRIQHFVLFNLWSLQFANGWLNVAELVQLRLAHRVRLVEGVEGRLCSAWRVLSPTC
jgi:hypothetical protein